MSTSPIMPDNRSGDKSPQDANETATYIECAVDYLKELQNKVDQHESAIKSLKKQIQHEAQRLIENAPTQDETTELATEIYWFLEFVPSSIVYAAMGSRQNQILKHIYPASLNVKCKDCGVAFDVTLTSRTKLNTLRRAYRNGDKYDQARCPTCEEIEARKSADRTIHWQREEEKRLAEILRLRTMPYKEYLQTEHWRNLRGQMLKRAKFHCQLCNRGDISLHVHHRTYERRGNEQLSDLIVLCATCHETFHTNGAIT